jgi:hypothetical protein
MNCDGCLAKNIEAWAELCMVSGKLARDALCTSS